MSACATPGCDGEPQWPSIRRSQTWCAACLAGFAHARGYSTEHTLTEPKQRWLLTHQACGRQRHSNLATVRKAEPVCPYCKWTAWAASGRADVLPKYAAAIVSAARAGDLAAASQYAQAYAHHYVWQPERTREVFSSVDAALLDEPVDGDGLDPLGWSCMRCGYIDATPPERMLGQASASWVVCHACNQQRLHQDPAPLVRYFSTRGLALVSTSAADRSVAYDAVCQRCGSARRVSVSTLTSGAPPCLRCDGQHLDPAAPHRVYLFHFPALRAYKVGITHCADDSRLRAHAARGGDLVEVVTVADRSAAVVLERVVLDRFRLWPAEVHVGHFPQGGWTECWSTAAGRPALADVLADLLASSR